MEMTEIINQLKYGFGSPGETSNAILLSYKEAKLHDPESSTNELFSKVYVYRAYAEQINLSTGVNDGNYSLLSIQDLLDISNGCLAVYAFLLMNVDSNSI